MIIEYATKIECEKYKQKLIKRINKFIEKYDIDYYECEAYRSAYGRLYVRALVDTWDRNCNNGCPTRNDVEKHATLLVNDYYISFNELNDLLDNLDRLSWK